MGKIRGYMDKHSFYDVVDEMFQFYLREADKGINVFFFSSFNPIKVHVLSLLTESKKISFYMTSDTGNTQDSNCIALMFVHDIVYVVSELLCHYNLDTFANVKVLQK